MTYRVEVVTSVNEESFLSIYNSNKTAIITNSGYEEYERLLMQFKMDGSFIVAGIDNDTNNHVAYGSGVLNNGVWHLTNIITKSPTVFMELSGDLMHTLMLENNISTVKTWCKKDGTMLNFVQASSNRPDLYRANEPVYCDEDFVNIFVDLI